MTENTSLRAGSVRLDFGDGEHPFRLGVMTELRELQDLCGAGPMVIYRRLTEGEWKVPDVRETIRLGLIGGGMSAPEALKLVRRYVESDSTALAELVPTAAVILAACLFGVAKEPPPAAPPPIAA